MPLAPEFMAHWKEGIAFLRQLPVHDFYFGSFVKGWHKTNDAICGTVCCFVGHAPNIWPGQFSWLEIVDDELVVQDKDGLLNCAGAAKWLGITEDESSALFLPWWPDEDGMYPWGPGCGGAALPGEVADMFERFLIWKNLQA